MAQDCWQLFGAVLNMEVDQFVVMERQKIRDLTYTCCVVQVVELASVT